MMAPDYDKKVQKEGSRVRESSRVQQEIPEEGQRAHRLKRCAYNNKDEDNSPNNHKYQTYI